MNEKGGGGGVSTCRSGLWRWRRLRWRMSRRRLRRVQLTQLLPQRHDDCGFRPETILWQKGGRHVGYGQS